MRWLLLLILLAIAPPAHAEDRMWRVGLLSNSPPPTGVATHWRSEILRILAQNGFSAGKNLELVERYSGGHSDRLPTLAHEINAVGVDVIVAVSPQSVRAALEGSQATPIVMVIGDDPVATGIVASLAHPGGRVTGIFYQTREGDAKRLQLLKDAMPGARRFGYLGMSDEPAKTREVTQAAAQLGVELTTHLVSGPSEYEAAFAAMKTEGVAGVVVGANQPLATHSSEVTAAARVQRLPTICEWAYMARVGCVFGFGHDLLYGQRRVGEYVARILKGTLPADLPVERPDAWKLTINLKAADAMRLAIPVSVMARASEVIE